MLTGNQQPDHSRISDFRRVHLDALAVLLSLGNMALDGTKMNVNPSKHNAISHERMLKAEAQLEAEIAALLRMAELIGGASPQLVERLACRQLDASGLSKPAGDSQGGATGGQPFTKSLQTGCN